MARVASLFCGLKIFSVKQITSLSQDKLRALLVKYEAAHAIVCLFR